MRGKSAMVWILRNWKNGDHEAQVDHALELGLDAVGIKIINGTSLRWEKELWFPDNQNADLLPFIIPALLNAGIKVFGWGWTYAGRWIAKKHFPSTNIARAEGKAHGEICKSWGITEFWIDAEREYQKAGMGDEAEAYMTGWGEASKTVEQYLCSYRWPLTHQPKFPVRAFEPYVEGWAPQVYFLGDSRENGGARQLATSFDQYMGIGVLPYVGIAPTYSYGGWRATKAQLLRFFEMAVDLGCEGVSVWDLPQASPEQLEALAEFDWPGEEPPPPPQPDPICELREIADRIYVIADELEED